MIKRVIALLYPTKDQFEPLRELWRELGKETVEYRPFGYILELEEASPEAEAVRKFISQTGMIHTIREERSYSENELCTFDFFQLVVTASAGEGGDVYGTEFDKDHACPACGKGWTQVSPLVIDKGQMKTKDIGVTYSFDYLVSQRLAVALQEEGCTGLVLRPTIHKGKGTSKDADLAVLQIESSSFLPPMVEPTVLMRSKEYCQVCGRHGLFLRSEPYYRRDGFSACDVNFTTEFFGEGSFPRPKLIISSRVLNVFKALKVKGYRVEPVHLK